MILSLRSIRQKKPELSIMPVAWVILPEKYELLEKRGYTYGAHCILNIVLSVLYSAGVNYSMYSVWIYSEDVKYWISIVLV